MMYVQLWHCFYRWFNMSITKITIRVLSGSQIQRSPTSSVTLARAHCPLLALYAWSRRHVSHGGLVVSCSSPRSDVQTDINKHFVSFPESTLYFCHMDFCGYLWDCCHNCGTDCIYSMCLNLMFFLVNCSW